jgi:hypothetical protein
MDGQARMNDADLLQGFEDCSLPEDLWDHRAHIRVASMYATRLELAEGISRMRSGIKAYGKARDVPEALDSGYHETITSGLHAACLCGKPADGASRIVGRILRGSPRVTR